MTEDHLAVYQFMISKFGGIQFDSLAEFQEAIKAGAATKRFLPGKTWGMYNIDTKEILAEGYLCRYGFDLIKVKQGKVTEYYRRLLSNKQYCFVSYDLETLHPIETYRNEGNQLNKYDWLTDGLGQSNNNCTYDTLPDDFKAAVEGFAYRSQIFMYAVKPYGRVVEFCYPRPS
jgi:hypothetical protein